MEISKELKKIEGIYYLASKNILNISEKDFSKFKFIWSNLSAKRKDNILESLDLDRKEVDENKQKIIKTLNINDFNDIYQIFKVQLTVLHNNLVNKSAIDAVSISNLIYHGNFNHEKWKAGIKNSINIYFNFEKDFITNRLEDLNFDTTQERPSLDDYNNKFKSLTNIILSSIKANDLLFATLKMSTFEKSTNFEDILFEKEKEISDLNKQLWDLTISESVGNKQKIDELEEKLKDSKNVITPIKTCYSMA